MSVLTLILAGGAGSRLSILGEKRAKPAVPFAGKYRIIDFPLSNAVNSDLYRVAVLTQFRPHSLMQHLGIGEPWDLHRRPPNGLQIWQPFRGRSQQDWYRGTADALYQNRTFIQDANSDTLLILSGDHIYKQDYRDLLRFHQSKRADLTVAVMNVSPQDVSRFSIMSIDSAQKITKFIEKPKKSDSTLASMVLGRRRYHPGLLGNKHGAAGGRTRPRPLRYELGYPHAFRGTPASENHAPRNA
jgi:glucose-1-phosphate adenylyltransferase